MASVISTIMRKELIQLFRDRRMVGVLFVAPVLQTVVFGYAINLDLTSQPAVIADLDRSPESRALVRALQNDDGFEVVGFVDDTKAAERAVFIGDAALALLVPRGFAADLLRNEAEVLLVLDGSDSNTALRAGQEAASVLNNQVLHVQRARITEALAGQGMAVDGLLGEIKVETRAWFNPQLKSALFFVPGVLALVLLVVTMLLTSMGLTREKEIGTLEQIMVTPIRPIELMVGKTLPFSVLGLLDVAFIVSVANLVFGVPVSGNIAALFVAAAIFLMTTLGLGLFISTISATQQQAMLTSFFVILPALMLSGYVFPIENMPQPVQWLTVVNPLRYYIEVNRGLMIKGASPVDLWPSIAALAGLGVMVLGAAASRFRKRVV